MLLLVFFLALKRLLNLAVKLSVLKELSVKVTVFLEIPHIKVPEIINTLSSCKRKYSQGLRNVTQQANIMQ